MISNSINIAGVEAPSDSPAFLPALCLHVPAGLVCVVTGVIAMLSETSLPTSAFWDHLLLGLSVVFTSATVLSVTRWAEDWRLFILGALSGSQS